MSIFESKGIESLYKLQIDKGKIEKKCRKQKRNILGNAEKSSSIGLRRFLQEPKILLYIE